MLIYTFYKNAKKLVKYIYISNKLHNQLKIFQQQKIIKKIRNNLFFIKICKLKLV